MEHDIESNIRNYQETRSEEAANLLLQYYRSMVEKCARKLSRSRPDLFEDLFQIGQMSLLRSLEKYDFSLGYSFGAYAMKSLVGHMKNYLRDKSWYIQVPRRIKEKGAQIQKAIDELTLLLKRSPEIREIAQFLELSEEETIEILACREYYQLPSLDVPLSADDDSASMGDIVPSNHDDFLRAEMQIDLKEAFETLEETEKLILHLVFNEGLSQRNVADQLGISQMSVSRIQKKAVSKLKKNLTPEPD